MASVRVLAQVAQPGTRAVTAKTPRCLAWTAKKQIQVLTSRRNVRAQSFLLLKACPHTEWREETSVLTSIHNVFKKCHLGSVVKTHVLLGVVPSGSIHVVTNGKLSTV